MKHFQIRTSAFEHRHAAEQIAATIMKKIGIWVDVVEVEA